MLPLLLVVLLLQLLLLLLLLPLLLVVPGTCLGTCRAGLGRHRPKTAELQRRMTVRTLARAGGLSQAPDTRSIVPHFRPASPGLGTELGRCEPF